MGDIGIELFMLFRPSVKVLGVLYYSHFSRISRCKSSYGINPLMQTLRLCEFDFIPIRLLCCLMSFSKLLRLAETISSE